MHFSVLNAELYKLSFGLKWMIVCQVGYYSLIGGLVAVVICNKTVRISTGRNTFDTANILALISYLRFSIG